MKAFPLILASLLAVAGCGGGGNDASGDRAAGRATVRIDWPAVSARLIPAAANFVTVTFSGPDTQSKTVARPAGGGSATVNFSGLPVGEYTLTASAYPTDDGNSAAQATVSAPVTIVRGTTITPTVTMASTIRSVVVAPANPTLAVGATVDLVATAYNGSAMVMTSPTSLRFTITEGGSLATLSTTSANSGGGSRATLTANAAGTVTVTATDAESGKSGTATVTISSTPTPGNTVVDLANAYYDTLSDGQKAATRVADTPDNRRRWYEYATTPNAAGVDSRRLGVAYSVLNADQRAAWDRLVAATLPTEGMARVNALRTANAALGAPYNRDYVYVGFVGTPSASGNWMLKIGGPHLAHNLAYLGSTPIGATPYFNGAEVRSSNANVTREPIRVQRQAILALTNALGTTGRLTSAVVSDLRYGSYQNVRQGGPGVFGGVRVGNLPGATQDLVRAAIAAWTNANPRASEFLARYEADLANTYVGYSRVGTGRPDFTQAGDYFVIDGPNLTIEFLTRSGEQNGSQLDDHAVWRDWAFDYVGGLP